MFISNLFSLVASSFASRSLRVFGFCQFVIMVAIGIFANGCAAPVQATSVESPIVPQGTMTVELGAPGQIRSVVSHEMIKTPLPRTNTGTCRFVVDGQTVDTEVQAYELARSLKVPADKIGTQCFKRDRLLGQLLASDFTVGK